MPLDPDAGMLFLDFVAERHRVWTRRQEGLPGPWTDDPILASRKFTNVFRVLDYGSQYVLTDLVDADLEPEDQLARLFLYRHTGRVEVWQHLEMTSGLPTRHNLDDVLAALKDYRGEASVRTRTSDPRNAARKTQTDFKRSVFTSAYLVFPQSHVPGTDKLESIVDLTRRLGEAGVWRYFTTAVSQKERFGVLRANKGVADFMSMQILTDWGYTPFADGDREDEFVVAGPGARKGAAALGLGPQEGVEWAVHAIRALGEDTPRLGDRVPSYMDAQNCLCEFSKYVRYVEKGAPGTPYVAAHLGPQNVVLPQHW